MADIRVKNIARCYKDTSIIDINNNVVQLPENDIRKYINIKAGHEKATVEEKCMSMGSGSFHITTNFDYLKQLLLLAETNSKISFFQIDVKASILVCKRSGFEYLLSCKNLE